jgi:hypothetical protein
VRLNVTSRAARARTFRGRWPKLKGSDGRARAPARRAMCARTWYDRAPDRLDACDCAARATSRNVAGAAHAARRTANRGERQSGQGPSPHSARSPTTWSGRGRKASKLRRQTDAQLSVEPAGRRAAPARK